jgi:hypothetical protein
MKRVEVKTMPQTNKPQDSSARSISPKIQNNDKIPVFQTLAETGNKLIVKG